MRTHCQAIISKRTTHRRVPCGRSGSYYIIEGELCETTVPVVLCWNHRHNRQMKGYNFRKVIQAKIEGLEPSRSMG